MLFVFLCVYSFNQLHRFKVIAYSARTKQRLEHFGQNAWQGEGPTGVFLFKEPKTMSIAEMKNVEDQLKNYAKLHKISLDEVDSILFFCILCTHKQLKP